MEPMPATQETRMGDSRYRQALVNAGFALYISLLTACCCPWLLTGEAGKLISFVVLSVLIAFVVLRPADVCRVATACLQMFPADLLCSPAGGQRSEWQTVPAFAVPKEPDAAPRFQRPPPAFSW